MRKINMESQKENGNKRPTKNLNNIRFYGGFVFLISIIVFALVDDVRTEGGKKMNKRFYDEVESIKMRDPFAVALGVLTKDDVFTYKYEDAVKLAGHSCLAVSGAYRLTQIALKQIYGDEIPVRGEIEVTFKGSVGHGANGPISQVVTLITGAAADNGFHGFGGKKFKRSNLLKFEKNILPPVGVICSVTFQRIDTGKSVEIIYRNDMLPANPKMAELMPLAITGTGSESDINKFAEMWNDRVRMVLLDDFEGMFVVNEQ